MCKFKSYISFIACAYHINQILNSDNQTNKTFNQLNKERGKQAG